MRPSAVQTDTHPGFMTDWQPPLIVLMTQAEGMSVIHETVYEDRLGYVDALTEMGGEIELFDTCLGGPACRFHDTNALHSAVVRGVSQLRGAEVTIPDVRAGFSSVIAAAVADGPSTLHGIHHLERGYTARSRPWSRSGSSWSGCPLRNGLAGQEAGQRPHRGQGAQGDHHHAAGHGRPGQLALLGRLGQADQRGGAPMAMRAQRQHQVRQQVLAEEHAPRQRPGCSAVRPRRAWWTSQRRHRAPSVWPTGIKFATKARALRMSVASTTAWLSPVGDRHPGGQEGQDHRRAGGRAGQGDRSPLQRTVVAAQVGRRPPASRGRPTSYPSRCAAQACALVHRGGHHRRH